MKNRRLGRLTMLLFIELKVILGKPMKTVLAQVLLLALAAGSSYGVQAAKKIPLSDAHYSGTATIESKASVSVTATTFVPAPQNWSTLAYGGDVWIPLSGKVKEKFLFAAADQQELADILRAELVRLGVFEDGVEEGQNTVGIDLVFKSGTYEHMVNEYSLTFEMTVQDVHKRRLARTYVVNSNERSSGWKKLNTSVWQGKMQLVQITLDKLIPDIQTFLQSAGIDGQKPTQAP